MKARWDLAPQHMVAAAIVAVCPVLVWLALDHWGVPTFALVGLLALIVAVYVGMRHPIWLYYGLAVALAGLPFGYFPGVHLPLYLPFAFGAVLAAALYPANNIGFHRIETAIFILVLVAGVSVVLTSLKLLGLIQYVRWAIVTLFAVALLRLSREHLERFGRIFVWVTTVNGLWGIFIVMIDHRERSFKILRPFGYGIGLSSNMANALENPSTPGTLRLGGTWVGPNGAGIAMAAALIMCLILFRGWLRACLALIIVTALLLTLSRQSIITVLVGFVLVLLFHSMRARVRWSAVGSLAMMIVVVFSVPYMRHRLIASFSNTDAGASSRKQALHDFPHLVSGHWLFGLGWARPEFKSGVLQFQLNLISNAPLMHIYRAGIFTGLAFIAVCLVGCAAGYRAMRSDKLSYAIYGGVFIGYCFVALQLDHGVVDVPQGALVFSILLAFLGYVDQAVCAEPAPNELVRQSLTQADAPAAPQAVP